MGDRYGAFMWYPRWSVRRALLVLSVRSVLVADHRFVSAPKGRVVTTRNSRPGPGWLSVSVVCGRDTTTTTSVRLPQMNETHGDAPPC